MSIKLERIREDAADSEWIEAFSAVLQEYEHPNSSAPTPSNNDMVIAFKLIHKKLATYDQGDDTLVLVLLDTLRVLLRYRENVGESVFSKLMRALLRICSFEGHNAAALLAARCLINILFDNPPNVGLFLSVEVDGVAKVAHILERHYAEAHLIAETEEVDCLHFHLVRVLHMMVCQSESAREALRPVHKPHPLTYSLVRALIQRLHLCVTPTMAAEANDAYFPHSEAGGKLYLEIARLLYVLDWHVALHVHPSAHHTERSVVDSNGASSVLNRLLIVTILSAIVKSSVSYTIPDTPVSTEISSTAAAVGAGAGAGVLPHSLCSLKDQCQDVSVQLAMFLPTECYADHAVLTELSALMHCAVGSAAPVTTTASEGEERDSTDGKHDAKTTAMHIDAVTRVSLHLVSVLHRQLQQAHNEYHGADSGDNSGTMRPVEQCALLSPVLVVLTNFCSNNTTALGAVKRAVFPHAYSPLSSASNSNKMDPTDVPLGTLRYYLIKLMISLDSQLKRCVAEFLYMLCAEDADEFTARTGFGNAVALLQIKGLC